MSLGQRLRHLAALLALLAQIGLGAVVPAQVAPAAVPAGWVICHAAGPDTPARGAPRDRGADSCALCPLCLLSAPAAVLASPPALPTSRVVAECRAVVASGHVATDRGPGGCAYPRGPPLIG